MAKQTIFIAGEKFDVTKHLTVAELMIQDRLDGWLGKNTVTVKLNKPTADEIEVTIFRKYGEFYKPPTGHSFFQSIFAYDQQILLGEDCLYGSVADLTKYEGQFIHYYCVDDFFNRYKKSLRKLKASKPKELYFSDTTEYMKLTIKL
jgi:hypothetical protein